MERHTGEPCAVKAASTVRRGAVGKVPKGNSLVAYPTMEQVTKPVEGAIRWSRNGGDNSALCKFRVAPEAIEGGRTTSQLSREQEIHPTLIQS